MKSITTLTLCALTSLIAHAASAQSKNGNTLQPPPANIKVDGDLKEWGDSLRYYNVDKKLNYSLANDKENLYMAIRINDRSEQMRLLAAGLTLGINPKGKKKDTYSITFPVGEQGGMPTLSPRLAEGGNIADENRDEMMRARLTKLRNIKVEGFSDIESEIITTNNTYGINVAIDYDKDGYLTYEAAIPLKFFHLTKPEKEEWAFNFRINGVTRPTGAGEHGGGDNGGMGGGRGGMGGGRGGMGGGRGGMGGGRGGMGGGRGGIGGGMNSSDHSEMSKSVEFWEKYQLGNQ